MGIFDFFSSKDKKESLDKGLEKTKESFFGNLGRAVLGKSTIDEEVLDNLEETLVMADVGIDTTLKIIDRIQERVQKDKYLNVDELDLILKEEIAGLLSSQHGDTSQDFVVPQNIKPYVIMVVGVNGVGKTTTIGKLAAQFQKRGYKIVLGAGDTFRAAAVVQLKLWG
jgi:fused signal recognition particle receptor